MGIYENNNSSKANLAPMMLQSLIATFGGTFQDYAIMYGGENPNYLYLATELATDTQLADFVDNFQRPIDLVLIQTQLANATRGLFIKRKFSTILDKREIKTWL